MAATAVAEPPPLAVGRIGTADCAQANELAAESDLGRTAALVTAKRIGDKIVHTCMHASAAVASLRTRPNPPTAGCAFARTPHRERTPALGSNGGSRGT